jgi:hypothetical protein
VPPPTLCLLEQLLPLLPLLLPRLPLMIHTPPPAPAHPLHELDDLPGHFLNALLQDLLLVG